MTATPTEAEAHRRALRRLATRVSDTYARSAMGGFLYLIGFPPLVYVTGIYRRHVLATALVALSLVVASWLGRMCSSAGSRATALWRFQAL